MDPGSFSDSGQGRWRDPQSPGQDPRSSSPRAQRAEYVQVTITASHFFNSRPSSPNHPPESFCIERGEGTPAGFRSTTTLAQDTIDPSCLALRSGLSLSVPSSVTTNPGLTVAVVPPEDSAPISPMSVEGSIVRGMRTLVVVPGASTPANQQTSQSSSENSLAPPLGSPVTPSHSDHVSDVASWASSTSLSTLYTDENSAISIHAPDGNDRGEWTNEDDQDSIDDAPLSFGAPPRNTRSPPQPTVSLARSRSLRDRNRPAETDLLSAGPSRHPRSSPALSQSPYSRSTPNSPARSDASHDNVGIYPCGLPGCDATFETAKNATRHRNTTAKHGREPPHKCPRCGKRDTRIDNHKRHIATCSAKA